ncbi:GNAT family N-acetyltransferase [Acidisphaera sp. S103]|uniref:GNAT family N-acetyltransferase n=1 Tax=Acidisphaera sp. S103 TaxID=1747223 RepID=UPI00131D65E4|nr:GNAT family N-acetyltransferase [Acidisphaera sp. S103]
MYCSGMAKIRLMTADDIDSSQGLLSQLGYPLESSELRRRYDAVARCRDHALFVAEDDGRVVALCHVYARPALDKPPEAIVQALVVDTAARSTGVGKGMMVTAETWARNFGFKSVALGSSVTRSDAHAFYEAIGYERTATSHLFRKDIQA